jgi:transcriptional regulator with XRE-family HTH domain
MRLAEARRRTGYSAREFAKATGSSTRTIWELEKGRRLPQSSTVRKFAEVLSVSAGEVEEFREAIRQEAYRGVPIEVLVQVEEMEVDLVNSTVIRIAAQRSLREVMKYLVEQGDIERVDRIYREVCGEDEGKEASIDSETIVDGR